MFNRIARVFKSWLGFFVSFAEDPEVMLQQSIEEMRNTLPRLNQVLVTTRATAIRCEQEKDDLERKERQLTGAIQAALQEGSAEARRIAEENAMTLQQVRQDLAQTRDQLTAANQAYESAQLSVEDIKAKLRDKIEQSRRAIQESKKATVLRQAASALSELDTYDTGATTDKYLDQIKQRSAEAKAAVEVATGGANLDRIKSEHRVRQLQAQSILAEFETEMGLKKPDATREAAPFPTAAAADAVPPAAAPDRAREGG
jgi:phage shock protein A